MATIRPMEQYDIIDVEYICRMTAGEVCRREPVLGNVISKMYSTYYARECRETSFVLVNEKDRPVGYVLCESDYRRFRRDYLKNDVPDIWRLNKKHGLEASVFHVPYDVFGRKYPAHLHIDILPEYQSKGYGQEMIKTLLNKLKEMNIPGVMLITNRDNKGAIRFYERLGFKTLLAVGGPVIMAKNLTE